MQMDIVEFTSLVLQFVFSVSAFYIALMFFLKIKRTWGKGVDLTPFYGIGFASFFAGLTFIFFGYEYYFVFEFGTDPLILFKAATLSGYAGIIGFVFFSEKMLRITKFGFTIFSIIACIFGVFFLNTVDNLRFFAFITMPISAIFIIFNFVYSLIIKTRGEIRRKMGEAFVCFLGFFLFYFLSSQIGKTLFPSLGELIVVIAMIGLLISLTIWGSIFLGFETFTEFGWKEKMRELFIIAPNGATLFHHPFTQKSNIQSADLISAGLTGIKDLLGEMIQSKQKLKTVDHQDLKILFEYGTYSTIALVVSENLHIYRSKLIVLSTQFERLFQDVLPHWTGNIDIFLPAKQLITDIFS